MNTTEIKSQNKCNNFYDMWKIANEQFLRYEKIEGIDNWKEYDFSIDCAEDQMKFKDMMQIRFIEELTEAADAIVSEHNYDHFLEEIADALNFFLSGYIMLGKDINDLPEIILTNHKITLNNINEISELFFPVIYRVGKLCNLLKNRPWSQSNYLCSLTDFNRELINLWNEFWNMINCICNESDILDIFWRKIEVNKFRIKTGY